MSLLDDNIYAQNVALKNQSIGGFQNPLSNMQPPNFSLPMNMTPPAPPAQTPKQGIFSKLIFGNNAPLEARPINPNNQPNNPAMNADAVRQFLESIPEGDRLIASMNPEKYMQEKIEMEMHNREKTTEIKNIERYQNDPDYAETVDKLQGKDPFFEAELMKAKEFGQQGLDYFDMKMLGVNQYTPFMKKRDENFAKVTTDFYDKGGFAVQMTNIDRLTKTIETVIKDPSTTGIIQGTLPDTLLAMLGYGEAVQTREAVASIVYQTLRATLGAQFTEKEGQRLISASFNPLLSPEQNARRLQLMLQEILAVASSKHERIRHVEKYGTLAGFKGEMPAFDRWKDDPEAMLADVKAESYDIVSAYISVDDYAGMTLDELQRYVANLDEDIDNYERQFIEANRNKIMKNLKEEE